MRVPEGRGSGELTGGKERVELQGNKQVAEWSLQTPWQEVAAPWAVCDRRGNLVGAARLGECHFCFLFLFTFACEKKS